MARFTSRSFRKHVSKKSRKSRKSRKTRKVRRLSQNGGGDTFSRAIPKEAVIANPIELDINRSSNAA